MGLIGKMGLSWAWGRGLGALARGELDAARRRKGRGEG